MTESCPPNSFDELAKKLHGYAIDDYARGSAEMEAQALEVCRPAMAALTLSEDYASLILTSRMSNELRKLIRNGLCKKGCPDELLFGTFKPLGDFSAKINAAYVFGLVTINMYHALNCSRRIRNCYAHTDNPDEARQDAKYTKAKDKLLRIDASYTTECVAKLRTMYETSRDHIQTATQPTEILAIMVEMCESLGRAAFFSQMERMQPRRPLIPACFGFDDTMKVSDEIDAWLESDQALRERAGSK